MFSLDSMAATSPNAEAPARALAHPSKSGPELKLRPPPNRQDVNPLTGHC